MKIWKLGPAVVAWLCDNDANTTGLTGRARRYLENISGNSPAAHALMAHIDQPWYALRSMIERDAKD